MSHMHSVVLENWTNEIYNSMSWIIKKNYSNIILLCVHLEFLFFLFFFLTLCEFGGNEWNKQNEMI